MQIGSKRHWNVSIANDEQLTLRSLKIGRSSAFLLRFTAKGARKCLVPISFRCLLEACYKLEHSGDLVPVDEFVVSSSTSSAVVSFDGDNAGEVKSPTSRLISGRYANKAYNLI